MHNRPTRSGSSILPSNEAGSTIIILDEDMARLRDGHSPSADLEFAQRSRSAQSLQILRVVLPE